VDAFRAKMKELQAKKTSEDMIFEVIPGAGHHSKNKAVIKPKIIEELQSMKVPFEEKNAGSLNVTIKANSAAAPAPTTATKTGGVETSGSKKSTASQEEEAGNALPKSSPSKFGCCTIC
jgi:hypothetical protein